MLQTEDMRFKSCWCMTTDDNVTVNMWVVSRSFNHIWIHFICTLTLLNALLIIHLQFWWYKEESSCKTFYVGFMAWHRDRLKRCRKRASPVANTSDCHCLTKWQSSNWYCCHLPVCGYSYLFMNLSHFRHRIPFSVIKFWPHFKDPQAMKHVFMLKIGIFHFIGSIQLVPEAFRKLRRSWEVPDQFLFKTQSGNAWLRKRLMLMCYV